MGLQAGLARDRLVQGKAGLVTKKSEEFKANLEAALQHGIDISGRRIFLQGDVDEDSISMAIRGMYLMADESKEPIELFVASYGGSIDEAFALHDVTRIITCPIHTIALGFCQSAAPLLVACGRKGERCASENCEFMMHPASMGAEGTPTNVVGTAQAVKARGDRFNRLLAKYTKKDLRFWRRFDRGDDHYFDSHQALEWGLIDYIWSEKD